MGRQDLYLRMLRKFAASNRTVAEQTRRAGPGRCRQRQAPGPYAQGAGGQYRRWCTAGGGPPAGGRLSPPGPSPALPGLLERFETELQSVIRTLETRLPAGSTDPAPQPLAADPHRLEAACRRIANCWPPATARSAPSCRPTSRCCGGLGQDLDAIAQATEDFDFRIRLWQQLRTAALTHGIALEEQRA